MKQKLWQKSYDIEKKVEEFTVGQDAHWDIHLAPFDVLGSLAHTKMLTSIDLLTEAEHKQLQAELIKIYQEIEAGQFQIEEGVEDVHSQVEVLLTRRLGEVGKKIHSGRSRNDQVLVDLKLFIRESLTKTVHQTNTLFEQLISLSEKYADVLLPGYTHLQVAMPSSFGLWFGAYAESLVDDLILLQAAFQVTNKNPLGSAAGYGSSFPLNRTLTTQLLGFDTLHYNVVYAQMSRGKTEKVVSMALASIASTLGKMAMDICLYMSQNFAFLSFPDELTTGSSIMPHKKNPDVLEIMRGKCNLIQGLPQQITLLTANLPSGYHREMQLIKESFFPAFAEINSCLEMMGYMLERVQIRENILDEEKYLYLYSVEVVNQMVLEGTPFRDAYQKVGEMIAQKDFQAPKEIKHTHEGSIGNLCHKEVREEMKKVLEQFPFAKIEKARLELLTNDKV